MSNGSLQSRVTQLALTSKYARSRWGGVGFLLKSYSSIIISFVWDRVQDQYPPTISFTFDTGVASFARDGYLR